jgi:flagellar protein FlgJ
MGMSNLQTSSNTLAADAAALGKLKAQAGSASPQAMREAARQLESLFMRELIKSMREAPMKSGKLDSPGSDLGTDLLDTQLALQMSGRPGGLSEQIVKQLSRQSQAGNNDVNASATIATSISTASTASLGSDTTKSVQQFVDRFSNTAAQVEQTSGLPASFVLGQAGHESGWGQREIRRTDGTPSYNLFGIKADSNWKGKVAEVTTTEYERGSAHKVVARFRDYDSYQAAFQDYARLLTQSPRYAQVTQSLVSPQAFAQGLQRAGYATDPAYADKLSRAINSTLRAQRLQA